MAHPADSPLVKVDLDSHPHVAIVSFGNGRNNFISYELVDELASEIEGLSGTGTRAIVLRTDSRHFCAGAQFGGSRKHDSSGRHIFDVVPRFFHQPLPIVAAIGGAAIGAGLGLALVADFRVAATRAYFAAPFTRLGVSQGFAISATLPRLLGPQHAADLIYTGRRVSADEALSLGLCDRVCEPEALEAEALALAMAIAQSAPLAVASARRTLRADLVGSIEEVLRHELAEQSPLFLSQDFKEGVQAQIEGRLPDFRGE